RFETERLRFQATLAFQRCILVIDGEAVHLVLRNHEKADGMDRCDGPWGQHGSLHALLTPASNDRLDILKISEFGFVHARLGADRERLTNLGNHDADLPGRNLDHRVTCDIVDGPELELDPRHHEPSLVPRFTSESDDIAGTECARAEA